MKRIVSVILCLAFIIGSGYYVFVFTTGEKKTKNGYSGVLRLWHIDLFEGGKGSRAAFLTRAAGRYEKKVDDVYIMVSTYTAEGAAQALSEGNCPDLLSFSCGVTGAGEVCRTLSFSFCGGKIGENCYAYPWCSGAYYLFCLQDDFSAVDGETLLISDGGNNLPWVAAAIHGISGQTVSEDSTSAYVHFLNGKYRYMLGTQRDVCRFQTRGVSVYSQALQEYSDLYQYIAVTTKENEAVSVCEDFVTYLLSEETQDMLSQIGMYSAVDVTAKYTLSAFVEEKGLNKVKRQAQETLIAEDKKERLKILKNYLKALN